MRRVEYPFQHLTLVTPRETEGDLYPITYPIHFFTCEIGGTKSRIETLFNGRNEQVHIKVSNLFSFCTGGQENNRRDKITSMSARENERKYECDACGRSEMIEMRYCTNSGIFSQTKNPCRTLPTLENVFKVLIISRQRHPKSTLIPVRQFPFRQTTPQCPFSCAQLPTMQ